MSRTSRKWMSMREDSQSREANVVCGLCTRHLGMLMCGTCMKTEGQTNGTGLRQVLYRMTQCNESLGVGLFNAVCWYS